MKKKPIFIIVGAVIIFILILVWVYLLFFGAEKDSDGEYSNLTPGGEELGDLNNENNNGPEVDLNAKLRQLTTREVAGFEEINTESGATISYVEMGTGHIYSIDPRSGNDDRVSGTTVPGVVEAKISPSGDMVTMSVTSNTKSNKLVVGEIKSNKLTLKGMDIKADHFHIGDGEELLYTKRNDDGLAGYSHNFSTGLTKNIFDIPFHEATIEWGDSGSDSHYFYPKTSYLLEGYLYKIENRKISRTPVDGFGLAATAKDNLIVYSSRKGSNNLGFVYDQENREITGLTILTLPEKCDVGTKEIDAICAYERTKNLTGYPDSWYQGQVSYKDSLWQIKVEDGVSTMLVDTFETSGREIDVTNLTIGKNEDSVYFINKNDNTLWIYEL